MAVNYGAILDAEGDVSDSGIALPTESVGPAPAPTKYGALLDAEDGGQAELQRSFVVATDKNPDRHAQVVRLADEMKMPPAVVEEFYDDILKKKQRQSVDYAGVERSAPALSGFLKNPDNAAIVQDDVDPLVKSESSIQEYSFLSKAYKSVASGAGWLKQATGQFPAYLADLANAADNDYYKAIGRTDLQVTAPEWVRKNALAESGRVQQEENRAAVPELSDDVIDLISKAEWGRASRATALQVLANAPQLTLSIGSAFAGLGAAYTGSKLLAGAATAGASAIGGLAAATANQEGLDKGMDPADAAARGTAFGAYEILFERAGTGTLVKNVAEKISARFGAQTARNVLVPMFQSIGYGFASEAMEEGGTEIAQKLTDWALGDKDALKNFFSDVANSALIGGVSGSAIASPSGILAGAARGREIRQAQLQKDFYLNHGAQAETSKTRERSSETHEQVVAAQTFGTPVENISIDVRDVDRFFQSSNENPVEALQKIGLLPEYEKAKSEGGEMTMPFATWQARTVGTPLYQGVADDIRFGENEASVNEAKAISQRTEETAAQAEEIPFAAGVDIREQLKATGGYTAEQIESQAQSFEAYYRTSAERLGITPDEAFRIENPGGLQVRAEDPTAGQLNQGFELQNPVTIEPEYFAAPDGKGDREIPRLKSQALEQLGFEDKPVVIKETIARKNKKHAQEIKGRDAEILSRALYQPTHLIQSQPKQRPDNWSFVHKIPGTSDHVLIELQGGKGQYEVVGWHPLSEKSFKKLVKRAKREGGRVLITPETGAAAALSALPPGSGSMPQGGTLFQGGGKSRIQLRIERAKALGFDTSKVWYHGTPAGRLDEFDPYMSPRDVQVVFFTEDKEFARSFARNEQDSLPGDEVVQPFIHKVYLRTKNTFDYEDSTQVGLVMKQFSDADIETISQESSFIDGSEDARVELQKQIEKGNWAVMEDRTVFNAVKQAGFDSMHVNEGGNKNLAVFEPNQIRSINAEFDPQDVDSPKIYAQGDETPRGSITLGDERVIRLGEAKNLSTFIHESGHLYLDGKSKVDAYLRGLDPVSLTDSHKQILADNKAILDWLGVASFADIKTEHHEQFARGWEAFHLQGKAPSQSLRDAFRNFGKWLTTIYKRLEALNVKLTPEITDVMKRMLATDAEIAEAESTMSAEPLFPDPSAFGMTGEKAERYRAAMSAANQASKDALNEKLLADVRQKQTAEYKSRLEEITAEAQAEADASPLYLAIDAMSANPELSPDQVAEVYGLSSGDELTKRAAAAPSKADFVSQTADARMKELYPELLESPTLSEEAINSLHHEKRAELLRMELEHLASNDMPVLKEVIRRVTRRPPARAFIRAQAQEVIARRKVGEIQPGQFRRAESRAAREAGELLAKGDLAAAYEAKERQLYNFELYRAALEAKAEIDSTVTYLSKFNNDATRAKLGKAGGEYLDQIDALMERFDFRRSVSRREIEKRKSLVSWVEEQTKLGLEPVISAELLNEAYRTSYKEMTPAELADLRDTVENINHLAGLKNKLLKSSRKRDIDEAINESVTSINENSKGARPKQIETRLPQNEGKRLFSGFLASHRKFASFIRQMDGWKDGGVLWDLLVRPMNDAGNREAVLNEQAAVAMKGLFSLYSKSETLSLYKKEFIPEIDGSLSKMGQLVVALNWGSVDNRAKLMRGRGWNESQAQAILDRLDERDWEFVKGVWKHIDSYWAETNAINKRVTGLELGKVEASAFKTKFGEVPGGYFPLKYDDRLAPRAFAHVAKDAADRTMRGGALRSTTKHGFRKERVENVDLPVRLDFGVIFEHVAEVIHDQSHYEFLVDMNRLLGDKRLQAAIIEHYGDQVYAQLRETVQDVAGGNLPAVTAFEKSINHLRAGLSISVMGYNLMTSIQQPLGLTQSVVRVGPKWIAKGLSTWIGDAFKMESRVKWIHEKSDFMRLRGKTQTREISEIRNDLSTRGVIFGDLDSSYFYLIQKMQMVADIPTWLGAYEKAMAESDVDQDAEAMESRAVALADQAVIDSQGSGQMKDLAQIQRGGPLKKLWTAFYSFFNTTYNLNREAFGRANFKSPASLGVLAVDLLMLNTVPATLGLLLKTAKDSLIGGDDDDEELGEKLLRENVSYLMSQMVLVRELGGIVQGFQGYEGPAGARFFSEIGKFAKQAGQGEADEAFFRSLNKTGGIVFHYPAGQIERTVRGFISLKEGESSNPGVLLFGPPRN